MNRSEFLSNAKYKENFVYLLGLQVQGDGHDVQYVNADADVESVKCEINKLAFGYVLMTADVTGIMFFIMRFYLSDKKK